MRHIDGKYCSTAKPLVKLFNRFIFFWFFRRIGNFFLGFEEVLKKNYLFLLRRKTGNFGEKRAYSSKTLNFIEKKPYFLLLENKVLTSHWKRVEKTGRNLNSHFWLLNCSNTQTYVIHKTPTFLLCNTRSLCVMSKIRRRKKLRIVK